MLNWSGLTFPVSSSQIRVFERNNCNVSVNVFIFEETAKEIIPTYVTKFRNRDKHVNLLLLKKDDNHHYVWIKNFPALIQHRTKIRNKMYPCPFCMHPYSTQIAFQNHFEDCSQHRRQKVIFPEGENKNLVFKSYEKTEKIPCIIYADFESTLVPSSDNFCIDTHNPSGFCAYTVSTDPQFDTEPHIYSGEDCMKKFFEYLNKIFHQSSF